MVHMVGISTDRGLYDGETPITIPHAFGGCTAVCAALCAVPDFAQMPELQAVKLHEHGRQADACPLDPPP